MAKRNLSQKLIEDHLVSGDLTPKNEIGIRVDQVLQQDATGTLAMLELEALGMKEVKADIAVQYVDHNLLQTDFKNADDHRFLHSASKKFGYWFSGPGNGISHVVHMQRFGIPGKSLLGSDSHTCAAGAIAMLAMGAGGLNAALASMGEPYYLKMPKIRGIKLSGKLQPWVSAKDIILEVLRRTDVIGGRGYMLEYYGEGLANLSAWDRHVIANMGIETGATASIFPSDEVTRFFFRQQAREKAWKELKADEGCTYDEHDEINLSELEPLIALPSSPGKVVPVREVEGEPIGQVVLGSSANPGLRDFWIAGEMCKEKSVPSHISFDVNPTSRQILQDLIKLNGLSPMLQAGARLHQTGCMGCIGMGQAPAKGQISLRTMPRNFPGRSGTADDRVYLCSPETAVASALRGKITNPRSMKKLFGMDYPEFSEPHDVATIEHLLEPPRKDAWSIELEKGPNIISLPEMEPLPESFEVPVILKMGDNISTDEILKAGAEVLPLRSNIPEISKYAFWVINKEFFHLAANAKKEHGGHVVIAGENYAQGSSREHAALAPRFLGQRAVLAKSYARIGLQNLINYGIVPLIFATPDDYDDIEENDLLAFEHIRDDLTHDKPVRVVNKTKDVALEVLPAMSRRDIKFILAGGIINFMKTGRDSQ